MIEWWFMTRENGTLSPPQDMDVRYSTIEEAKAMIGGSDWPQLLKAPDGVWVLDGHCPYAKWKRYPDFDTAVIAIKLRS